MASNFTNFLIKLGADPQLRENYKLNPDDVMIAEGLTPAERALLLSEDAELIRKAFVNDPDHKTAIGIPLEQDIQVQIFFIVHP